MSSDPVRSAAAAVLAAARAGSYGLIIPPEVLAEAARVVGSKPWLASRIAPEEVARFLGEIASVAEVPQRLEHLPPPICRDPDDDYLIAHALLAAADLLVTRDQDLLDLGEIAGVRIVGPVPFLNLIRSQRDAE
jgi:putative PIN family toxin of toxin-antitoxin system